MLSDQEGWVTSGLPAPQAPSPRYRPASSSQRSSPTRAGDRIHHPSACLPCVGGLSHARLASLACGPWRSSPCLRASGRPPKPRFRSIGTPEVQWSPDTQPPKPSCALAAGELLNLAVAQARRSRQVDSSEDDASPPPTQTRRGGKNHQEPGTAARRRRALRRPRKIRGSEQACPVPHGFRGLGAGGAGEQRR